MFRDTTYKIKSVKWDGDREAEFVLDSVDSDLKDIYWGIRRKDFWHHDRNWEAILVPGVFIKLWSTKGSSVVGLQVLWNDQWTDVWCAANNFKTKAEWAAADKAYTDAIEEGATRLAQLMDTGISAKEAMAELSKDKRGLSLNQMAHVVHFAVQHSKNGKDLQRYWNESWDFPSEKEGVVNPAFVEVR